MKLSYFLLGLTVGFLLTAFATPPVRRPRQPQPIRGYRPPEPMATPVIVERIDPLEEINERVRESLNKFQNGELTWSQIINNRKAAMKAYVG